MIVPALINHAPMARGVIPSLLAFGLPQWSTGQLPPTFTEDFQSIVFGVILMPIVIPWGYVYRHYNRQPAAHWR